ncbi:MAG: hypothetical protein IJQ29_05680 [Synergistaceae bacterium]|nr:hypothetical protein [Synergistaceae bacterium]
MKQSSGVAGTGRGGGFKSELGEQNGDTIKYSMPEGELKGKWTSSGRYKVSEKNKDRTKIFNEISKLPVGSKITASGGYIGSSSSQGYEIKNYRGGKGISSTDKDASYAHQRGYKLNTSNLYKLMGQSQIIKVQLPK